MLTALIWIGVLVLVAGGTILALLAAVRNALPDPHDVEDFY